MQFNQILINLIEKAVSTYILLRGGGVQASKFLQHDFELWVGVDGLETGLYPHFEGGFGSMRAILPM